MTKPNLNLSRLLPWLFCTALLLCRIPSPAQSPMHFVIGEQELGNADVYSILQHPNGLLYVATDLGLFVYQHGRFSSIPWEDEHNGTSLFCLRLDADNVLHCTNLSGQIFRLTDQGLRLELQCQPEHISHNVMDLSFDDYGRVYTKSKDLMVYEDSTWTTIGEFTDWGRYSLKVDDAPLTLSSRDGRYLVRVNDDLTLDTVARFPKVSDAPNPSYFGPGKLDAGYAMVHREGFVQTMDTVVDLNIGHIHGPFQNNPNSLWIPSLTKGIRHCESEGQTVQLSEKWFPDRFVSTVYENEDGVVYLGTFGQGILVVPSVAQRTFSYDVGTLDGITVIPRAMMDTLTDLRATSYRFYWDEAMPEDSVVVVSTAEIFYSPDVTYHALPNLIHTNDKLKKKPVYFGSLKNVQWLDSMVLISSSSGLYKVGDSPEHITWYLDEKQDVVTLTETGFRCPAAVYIPKREELVYCTPLGVKCIHPSGEVTSVMLDEKVLHGRDLFATSDGAYCASHEGVLFIQGDQVVDRIGRADGLMDDQIRKIKVYGDRLYISHRSGFQVFDIATREWLFGNTLANVPGSITNFVVQGERLFLIAGDQLKVVPLEANSKGEGLELLLGDVRLGDEVFPLNSKMEVSYLANTFEIPVELRGFLLRNTADLEYRINQGEWQLGQLSDREITYASLSPGDYQVDVRVRVGKDTVQARTVTFSIRPPFWQQWSFYVLLILGGAGITAIVSRTRERRREAKQELILAKLEAELRALRSQMNPHFIFNALNSIQDLVMSRDSRVTYDYIVQFSKLVRMALNHSRTDRIALSEELDFLRTYLSLEQLRFSGELTYSIVNTAPDETEIPPLLIQPLVENALVHGLMHKDGPKELEVEISADNEGVRCIVRDNGIGREASWEIEQRQGRNHQPFATQALAQRLNLLNQQRSSTTARFELVDLKEGGIATGTEARLYLPAYATELSETL